MNCWPSSGLHELLAVERLGRVLILELGGQQPQEIGLTELVVGFFVRLFGG